MKQLLEDNFEEIARTITMENGKTLAESKGEMRRAIENVEVACGIPTLMQGYNLEDVARGIDEMMQTGKPSWPVERTLLTSGTLDALLASKLKGGTPLETPHLKFRYQVDWDWRQPPDAGLKPMAK